MKQLLLIAAVFFIAACTTRESPVTTTDEGPVLSIKKESVTYTSDKARMKGLVAYNEVTGEKRPVVLIVHEWWGLTDYIRNRAEQLAALGYLAMAVDLYGEGKTADDPETAAKMAGPFYQDPQLAKRRFDAAMATIKTHPLADTTQIAAIGYCFGGAVVLNVARLGGNLDGVVSFHGSLIGVKPDKDRLKANVLVCHGEADQSVKPQEVELFKKQMDSIQAPYTFKSYPAATHAFTNPEATENGKKFSMPIAYNAAADMASFNDMMEFFGRIFNNEKKRT